MTEPRFQVGDRVRVVGSGAGVVVATSYEASDNYMRALGWLGWFFDVPETKKHWYYQLRLDGQTSDGSWYNSDLLEPERSET